MTGRRLPPSARASVRVARGELRRTVRSILETPRETLGALLLATMVLAFAAGGGVGAYLLGRSLRADATLAGASLLPPGRGAVGLAWVALTVAVTFRTVAKVGNVDHPSLLLSTVSVRSLVVGKLLAEGVTLCCWLLLPVACVGAAFALGASTPAAVVALVLVALLTVSAAVPVGFVLGIGIKHLVTRYEPIARVKTPLLFLLGVAYLGVFVTGRVDSVVAALYGPLQHWPVSWLADLLFLSIPPLESAPLPAATGVGAAVALFAAAGVAAPRAAARHWLSDPPRTAPTASEGGPSRLDALIAPVTDRRTRSVTTAVWRRTVRSPIRVVFLAYPAFFAVEPARRTLESLQATGTVPAAIPPLTLAYVVWAAGMAFTLNPLGDQGATLPTTLSSPRAARAVVRGRLLIAVITCLPPALALVGLTAAFSPVSATGVVALLLATVLGVVAAPALATGIGTAFPRFGAVSVTRNRAVVVPSKTAAAVYSLAVFVLAGALSALAYEPAWEPLAALASWGLGLVDPSAGVEAGAVRIAAGLVCLPLALAPVLSYRYAVSRIETYALE